DVSRCLFCGLCVEVCPTKGLIHTDNFELACINRDGMIYDYSLPCTPQKESKSEAIDDEISTENQNSKEEPSKEGEQN
ncbi:MAG: 4Fe-4S binding protein, partial [Armatimonadota bacterium]